MEWFTTFRFVISLQFPFWFVGAGLEGGRAGGREREKSIKKKIK